MLTKRIKLTELFADAAPYTERSVNLCFTVLHAYCRTPDTHACLAALTFFRIGTDGPRVFYILQ